MQALYILEDDPLLGPTMQDLVELSVTDCNIQLFVYFNDFIAAVKQHPPRAAIVDLNVPDKAGADIVTELNAAFASQPIFVYSGDAEALLKVSDLKLPNVTTGFKTESFNLVNGWLLRWFPAAD
jgi:FixJ family two-component response regulator